MGKIFDEILIEMEETRKKTLEIASNYQKKGSLSLIFVVVSLILIILFNALNVEILVMLAIFCLVISIGVVAFFFFKAFDQKKKLKELLKDKVITSLVENEFENGVYMKNTCLPIEVINEAGLIKKPDRYHGEDYVEGIVDGVFFQTSDVDLKERRVRSNGKTTTVTYETYFKGRWYTFDFHKDTTGVLKVIESSFKLFDGMFSSFKKFKTESIEFNKKFSTLSNDEQMVFYILTPRMITKILDIEASHNGKIYFGFLNGKLHIGINDNKDYLEPNIHKELNGEELGYLLKDLNVIKEIALELKLNEKIFK